jgi:CheY-like chemotaxis protein
MDSPAAHVRALFAGREQGSEDAEAALRRLERLASLGTTLAGAAHELNNPLAAIIGFAQLLRSRPLAAEDLAAVNTILREAERTARIVRDLRQAVGQRDAGERRAVNVNDVVGYVAGMRRYTLSTHDIACSLALDTSLPRVLADRAQLEQVVLNLVLNAEQALLGEDGAARDGASIALATRAEGSDVVLEVRDNGPGIPESRLDRVWEAFYTTRPDSGSGLGLSVVRSIVAAHDGTVSVRRTEGGGATFSVRLPAASGAPAQRVPEATLALDVLLVGHDAGTREFLGGWLTSRGHAVLSVACAEEAVATMERMGLDVVIADADTVAPVNAFLERLRALPAGGNVRVVLAMGDAGGVATAVPAFEAPAIARPYDLDLLRRLIEDE